MKGIGIFAVCLALTAPSVANAAGVRLGLGANDWLDRRGLFDLTLAVDGQLARNVAVGGRFGAFVTSYVAQIGVPVDLLLRATVGGRVYLEGLVGPWIFFSEHGPIRAHAAFGFGLQSIALAFGLELGWLDPNGILGVKLAFRL